MLRDGRIVAQMKTNVEKQDTKLKSGFVMKATGTDGLPTEELERNLININIAVGQVAFIFRFFDAPASYSHK